MSKEPPEGVAIEPAPRHRWLRREIWFVVLAAVAVLALALTMRHRDVPREAEGRPVGVVPNSSGG